MIYNIENKIALVTGASGGIGKAISLELARGGAFVNVHYNMNGERASQIVDEIVNSGGKAQAVGADISNSEALHKMVDDIVERHGRIDILVNNAAVNRETLFIRLKDEDIDFVFGVNLIGLINVTRLCVKHMMKNRWGRIVHISSPAAIAGSPAQSLYSASKAAIHALSKSLAQELGSRNITSNVVLPGIINTRMIKTLTDERRDEFLGRIPMGRFGEPEEVAHAVRFLVSEEAGYISGAELFVTGGGSVW
jgi:3-oxoacyl-[acyl-carrier protein] reductase